MRQAQDGTGREVGWPIVARSMDLIGPQSARQMIGNGMEEWHGHQQTSNYTTLPQSPASSSLPSPGTLPWAMATQLEGNNLCFIASTRSLPFTPLSPMQHKDRYPSFSYVSRQQFACFSSLPGLFLQQKKHDKADPVRRAVGPCLYAGQYPMGTWR